MGNRYSAQHVSAFIIYELREKSIVLNSTKIQQLLKIVDFKWRKVFGQCAFLESVHSNSSYYIKEVFETYDEQFGDGPIQEPAREWFLPYGQFILQYRPYGVPAYSPFEKLVMEKIISDYIQINRLKAS